jgi:hypothetical protein
MNAFRELLEMTHWRVSMNNSSEMIQCVMTYIATDSSFRVKKRLLREERKSIERKNRSSVSLDERAGACSAILYAVRFGSAQDSFLNRIPN